MSFRILTLTGVQRKTENTKEKNKFPTKLTWRSIRGMQICDETTGKFAHCSEEILALVFLLNCEKFSV
jgi:succinate dehydrogenase flavin-adding protein (antitoxin of CptAB toxin-antitoxin module)